MLIDSENALPDDFDSPGSLRSVDGPPRVVVVYRKRGIPLLLVVPLLVFVATAAAMVARSLQRPTPVLVYVPEVEDRSAPVDQQLMPKPVFEPLDPTPQLPPPPLLDLGEAAVVAGSKVTPVPTLAPDESTTIDPEPLGDLGLPAPVAGPPVVVGFDPNALKAGSELPDEPMPYIPPTPAGPDAAPIADAPNRPFALDDIQREAKRVADERRRIASVKSTRTIPVPLIDRKLRDERVRTARRDAEIRRRPYLNDLKALLREGGADLAERIEALSDTHGRETAPALLDAAFFELQGPGSRLTTKSKVQRLRLWGVPEPIILDHLIDTESADIGGRRGPRAQTEAVVRAARVLLSIPLPEKQPAPSPSASK